MEVSLVLVMPDGKQSEISLRKPVQIIGRQTDCQIRIPSGQVSRHHCEISVGGDKVSVRDLGSSNGTYVNKRRVTQTELAAGDLIAVADLVFVVRLDGRPMAIESEDVIEDGQVMPASSTPAPPSRGTARIAQPAAKSAPAAKANDDSDADDFDFLNEDDDIKKQPKL